RLGRGAGYYDKYLSQPHFRGYTIGICYPHQLIETIPCEEHDVRLNQVIAAE
ncbi:MAG: 5-formyltetrahydrofolate cyclo-ligase, partial [Rikenellaceae bacterium]